MTMLLAAFLALQQTPGEALHEISEAVLEKNVERFNRVISDRSRRLDEKEFLEWIKEEEEDTDGKLVEVLKAHPVLGKTHPTVTKIMIVWRAIAGKKLVRIQTDLVKTGNTWGFKRPPRVRIQRQIPKGDGARAAVSPEEVADAVVKAVEKEDYATAHKHMTTEVRWTMSVEDLKEEIEDRQDDSDGHWLKGLKRRPSITESRNGLDEIDIGWTYVDKEEQVQVYAGLSLVKEADGWKIREFGVHVTDLDEDH
jgi:hypothetical protein